MSERETKIKELLKHVKAATGPDRRLDYELFVLFAVPEQSNHWSPASGNEFTSSIDAALALAERALPGVFYLFGKGRLSATEPLFACQFLFGPEVVGQAEHNEQTLAILAALLSARALALPQTAQKD